MFRMLSSRPVPVNRTRLHCPEIPGLSWLIGPEHHASYWDGLSFWGSTTWSRVHAPSFHLYLLSSTLLILPSSISDKRLRYTGCCARMINNAFYAKITDSNHNRWVRTILTSYLISLLRLRQLSLKSDLIKQKCLLAYALIDKRGARCQDSSKSPRH